MERQEAGKNLAPNQGPMSIVEKFLTDLITKEGREDAFSSVCEDVEYCGIWDEESINGKEAVCLKMVSWCENKDICLTGMELEHRMFSSQADLVMGKFIYGTTDREGRNTKTTVHVMVLCLLENEWKINKLYFSLPYHAGSESPSVYKRSICTVPGPEYCWNSAVVQILPMGLLVLCWCGDGNICYMNKTMLKYLGYCDQKEYERMSGNSIYSLLHSDEIASFKLHLEEVKAGGESKSFTCRLRTTGQCYDWLSVRVMLLPTCMRANSYIIEDARTDYDIYVVYKTPYIPPAPGYWNLYATVENGTISPEEELDIPLSTGRTVRYSPNSGYVLESITVDGVQLSNPASYANAYQFYEENEGAVRTIHVVYKETDSDGTADTWGNYRN